MADDINITFGADTTELDAAVTKVKREIQSLVPGAPGSGVLTPLPAAFGGAPATLLEKATVAAKANAAAAAQAGTAMKNYGLELEEAGNKAARAGIDFGRMAERMATRIVIFEMIRLAIQGVKYAFDEISKVQQAQIQFNAMADGLDHLGARFKQLQKDTKEALIPEGKAVQVIETLQDYGASADQAGMAVKDLGKWSNVLGVDANTLAQALGRVSEGEGSLQDMRLVTHMMGEQAAAGRTLVQTIVDMTRELKNFEAEQATAEKSMDAVMRATERMGEKRERTMDRQLSITEKLANAQAEWDRKYAGGTRTGEELLTQQFQQAARGREGALIPAGASQEQRNLLKSQLDEYKQGVAELTKTLGPIGVQQALRPAEQGGWLGYRDVIQAYKERHQDEMRDLREADEDRRAAIERQKTGREAGIAGAKAEFARVGPQAVTAPPGFAEYTNSIKGMGDQFKVSLDTIVQKFFDGVKALANPTDDLSKAVSRFIDLLAGAG